MVVLLIMEIQMSKNEKLNKKYPQFVMNKVGTMGDKGQTDFKITLR